MSKATLLVTSGIISVVALAAIIFTSTELGSNTAAVILGTNTPIQNCIEKLNGEGDIELTLNDFTITKARINSDSQTDYILKGTTETMCGSVGCIHELCVQTNGTAKIIPFGYAAETLTLKQTLTNGMHDIELQGKSAVILTWDGDLYRIRDKF